MTINNHGDLILIPVKTIKPPKTAKKAKIHILQQSGTTGNRHEVVSDIEIFHWFKGEQEFIHCDKDYKIRHVGGDCEHGEQIVEAGTREIKHELEYNPWENELRVVID
jgi:hypothetical protein